MNYKDSIKTIYEMQVYVRPYLYHMMELDVFSEKVHQCFIVTHEAVKQVILKLLLLILFILTINM